MRLSYVVCMQAVRVGVGAISTKLDTVLDVMVDMRDRIVKLEDLPDVMRQGFTDMGRRLKDLRSLTISVGCTGTRWCIHRLWCFREQP